MLFYNVSVQNGDFISVYIDCSWTNSFVVSRRLYSLPIRADVEIGRGFNVSILSQVIIYNPYSDKFYRFNSFIIYRKMVNEFERRYHSIHSNQAHK